MAAFVWYVRTNFRYKTALPSSLVSIMLEPPINALPIAPLSSLISGRWEHLTATNMKITKNHIGQQLVTAVWPMHFDNMHNLHLVYEWWEDMTKREMIWLANNYCRTHFENMHDLHWNLFSTHCAPMPMLLTVTLWHDASDIFPFLWHILETHIINAGFLETMFLKHILS